jgi:hypothetical protein
MAGIYLDPANEENGALRVVPGSYKSNQSICELEKMPYATIAMEAGDMLVHDLMIAHSLGTLTSFPRRRVIYFEFMSEAQARAEGIYTDEFIRRRIQLIPAAKAFSVRNFRGRANSNGIIPNADFIPNRPIPGQKSSVSTVSFPGKAGQLLLRFPRQADVAVSPGLCCREYLISGRFFSRQITAEFPTFDY